MVKGVASDSAAGARGGTVVPWVLPALVFLVAAPFPATSQDTVAPAATSAERPLASRAQLEAQLDSLQDVRDASTMQAAGIERRIERIRERLREGDFRSGDLVELRVRGDADLTGTFSVNRNRALEAGELPPISLEGVLYSEVEKVLEKAISQYVRDPYVRARPLMRVAVVGGVGSPGYYDLPPTTTLSEALMQAGGPAQSAKLDEMEYRRGGKDLLEERREEVDRPVETLTLAELGARRGDQLLVPQGGGQGSVMTVLGVVSGISGVAWAISRVF